MISAITQPIIDFINHPDFFYYHGVTLAFLWFIAANIAILLRSVSRTLHALCFFVIDVTTIFFLVGGLIRVYPSFEKFATWNPIKQGHVIGGISIFIQASSFSFSWFYNMLEESSHF